MTAKKIAQLLARHPRLLGGSGKNGYVLLPIDDYRQLCEAVEDAMDLADLEQARRENSGDKPILWETARASLKRSSTPAARSVRSRSKAKK